MKGRFRRIVRGNAAHPHQHDVRPHVSELRHQALGVQGGIDFTKIRLHPTDGSVIHQPSSARASTMVADGQ